MKLEVYHITAYLPYKLKVEVLNYKCNYVGKQYSQLYSLEQWSKCGKLWSCDTGGAKTSLEDIKLILRPLSDLVNPQFASLGNEMNGVYSRQKVIDIINGVQNISVVSFYYIQLLLQNHFDIFGLIKNNLAIDINTLNHK